MSAVKAAQRARRRRRLRPFRFCRCYKGVPFSDPDKLADDCNLAGLKDLAGCAIVLKDCSFKLQEVDALLIEGMDMRFTLDSVLNVEDEFPFGVALPVGSFLDLLINPKAPSGLALIETLFRSLIRLSLSLSDIVLSKGQGGLVKDFEVNVAARVNRNVVAEAEVVETSPGGGGGFCGRALEAAEEEGCRPSQAYDTLVIVIRGLFDCMAAELNRVCGRWR